jgi:hypothetical protein
MSRLALPLAAALFIAGAIAVRAQQPFTVTVAAKTAEHPYFGQGGSDGFVIDGVQGKEITLVRGTTYTFQMSSVPVFHPFYITTSAVGAGADPYTDGVTGNFATGSQTLTFTPTAGTPDLLYYQCGVHEMMGWQINIVSSAGAADEAGSTAVRLCVTPNVVEARASVALHAGRGGAARVVVYDMLGRKALVLFDGETPAAADLRLPLDAAALAPGAYRVVATIDGALISTAMARVGR